MSSKHVNLFADEEVGKSVISGHTEGATGHEGIPHGPNPDP